MSITKSNKSNVQFSWCIHSFSPYWSTVQFTLQFPKLENLYIEWLWEVTGGALDPTTIIVDWLINQSIPTTLWAPPAGWWWHYSWMAMVGGPHLWSTEWLQLPVSWTWNLFRGLCAHTFEDLTAILYDHCTHSACRPSLLPSPPHWLPQYYWLIFLYRTLPVGRAQINRTHSSLLVNSPCGVLSGVSHTLLPRSFHHHISHLLWGHSSNK